MSFFSRKYWLLLLITVSSFLFTGCTDQWSTLFSGKKAGLQVMTGEISASVFINGQYGEKTPFINKNLSPGEYTIKIQPDNPVYVPHETVVTVNSGLLTVVTWNPGMRSETSGGVVYELEKLADKNKTEVSIISIPDRSIVSIDGQEKDFTPVIIDTLLPGQHELEVSLPSYNTQQHTINILAGHRLNVTVKLAKAGETPLPHEEEIPTSSASTSAVVATTSASLSKIIPVASGSSSLTLQQVPKPRVTIQSTNFFQDGVEVLRVRDQVGASGKELGMAKVGSSYPYLGESSQGWYKINFNTETGWVSGTYAKLEE